MDAYTSITKIIMMHLLENFERLVTEKPLISVIFPTSGLGSLYIPNDVSSNIADVMINVPEYNNILNLMDILTPYLKFLFLILTIILTILSVVLQLKKLFNKNKNNKNGGD